MPDEYKDFDRQTCPFCNGFGRVCSNCGELACSCGYFDSDVEDEEFSPMDCPTCDGTGWVE
ncbi:MAG: hypothetical protein E6R03_09145 [Hyphomicrobiaceae bacterium]|nr:MAG: hypothetical protein E6R03_09145 [Hyphomicrobiaceae bacterium]